MKTNNVLCTQKWGTKKTKQFVMHGDTRFTEKLYRKEEGTLIIYDVEEKTLQKTGKY